MEIALNNNLSKESDMKWFDDKKHLDVTTYFELFMDRPYQEVQRTFQKLRTKGFVFAAMKQKLMDGEMCDVPKRWKGSDKIFMIQWTG